MVCEGYKGEGENRDEIDFGETNLFFLGGGGGADQGGNFICFKRDRNDSVLQKHEYQIDSFYNCILGRGPYNYQKALYTGKHFYLPKSTEKTHARRCLYALWITFYVCWIIKICTCGKKRYTILKRD